MRARRDGATPTGDDDQADAGLPPAGEAARHVGGDVVLDRLTGTRCQVVASFPLTLGGRTLEWYYALDSGVIRGESQVEPGGPRETPA